MAKKKISSQDFLNLMDEQESGPAKMAFNPAREIKPKRVRTKMKPQPELLLGRFKLTPIQQEWLKFAEARTPRFVREIVASPTTQFFVKKIESQLTRLLKRSAF